ncbi:S8 family serine peptidase [Candidatus Woesearchaeota archaeon]|nr:S8 family serine peptidase [Candidatus Woesearchaeota archaeon]
MREGAHGGAHGSAVGKGRHGQRAAAAATPAVTFHSRLPFLLLAVVVFLGVVGFAVFNVYNFRFGAVGKAYSAVVLNESSFRTGAVLSSEASVPRQLSLVVQGPVSAATALISGTASGVTVSIGPDSVYEQYGELPVQPEQVGDFSYEINRQCSSFPCEVELTVVSASSGTVALSDFSLVPAVAESDMPSISVETDKNYYNIGDSVMLVGAPQAGSKPVSVVNNPKPEAVPGNITVKVQRMSVRADSAEPGWEDVSGVMAVAKDVSVPASGFLDIAAELGISEFFRASEPGRFRILAEFAMPDGSVLSDASEFAARAEQKELACSINFDCPVYHSCQNGVCVNFCGGEGQPGQPGQPGEPAEPPEEPPEEPGNKSVQASRSDLSRMNIARLNALGFEIEKGQGNADVGNIDLSDYSITAEGDAVVVSKGSSVRKFSGDAGSFVIADSKGNKILLKRVAPQQQKVASHIIELKSEPLLKYKASVEEQLATSASAGGAAGVDGYAGPAKDSVKDLVKNSVDAYKKRLADAKVQALLEMAQANPNLPGSIVKEYSKAFSGFAANLSDEEAATVRKLPSVRAVYPNGRVFALLDNSVNQISADEVWKLKDKNGAALTGKGVTIAIIDTGVDYTHPDLGGCFGSGCKVAGGYDFFNDDPDPIDDHGHGTHVAATAAGSGILKGVAPDATVYAYKVLGAGGGGNWDDVIAAIERSVDPNEDGDFSDHLDVISMSLGGSGNPDDPQSQAVDNAVSNGVVAVIAAGNSGPGSGTIGSPGTARKAITVGAVDKCDNIAGFSSRGPVVWEGGTLLKPDIVAPGVDICAAQWDSWLADLKCVDDRHIAISGTSMATPHVSGAAALLLQANPEWSPEDVKSAMMLGAHDLGLSPTDQGAGRLDVLRSLNPAISVLPNSVSFELSEGTSYSTDLEITNLLDKEMAVEFSAVTFDLDGKVYDFASVEPESLTLAPNGKGTVQLLVDVQPDSEGYFIGRISVQVPSPSRPDEVDVLVVPFSFSRTSQMVVSAVDSGGRPLLADFYLHSNDLEQLSRASFGIDYVGDSYTFKLKSGSYTVHAVSVFESPVQFFLSKAVALPVGSKLSIPLSTADARQFKVPAESFSKVPLRLNTWEKALLIYNDKSLWSTTYTAFSPNIPDGNKVVYVSDRPENGLNTDVIIDYEGYPTNIPK